MNEQERKLARQLIDAARRESLPDGLGFQGKHEFSFREYDGIRNAYDGPQLVRLSALDVDVDISDEVEDDALQYNVWADGSTNAWWLIPGGDQLDGVKAPAPHGSKRRYTEGCRCARCTEDHRRYYRERAARELLERSRARACKQHRNGTRPTRERTGFDDGGHA